MTEYIDRNKIIAEYDRVHVGEPGGARKLMVEAPAEDVVPRSEFERLKAELERLEKGELSKALTFNSETIRRCNIEAIKEFVRIHREYMLAYCDDDDQISLKLCEYDATTENLVKEMEQGNES